MSPDRLRIVVDTNVLVSAVVRAGSVPSQAVSLAQKIGILLLSDETAIELTTVLARPKMSRFVTATDVIPAITALCATADWVPVVSAIRACRDPRDNKFLSLAVSCAAHVIITGDDDLLVLHPFEGVAILTPRQFLERPPHPRDQPSVSSDGPQIP